METQILKQKIKEYYLKQKGNITYSELAKIFDTNQSMVKISLNNLFKKPKK